MRRTTNSARKLYSTSFFVSETNPGPLQSRMHVLMLPLLPTLRLLFRKRRIHRLDLFELDDVIHKGGEEENEEEDVEPV